MKTASQLILLAVLIGIAALITYPKLEQNQGTAITGLPYYAVLIWNGEYHFYEKRITYEFKAEE